MQLYLARFTIHAWGNLQQDYKLDAYIAQTEKDSEAIRQACKTLKLEAKKETISSERLFNLVYTFDIHRQEYQAHTMEEVKTIAGLGDGKRIEKLLETWPGRPGDKFNLQSEDAQDAEYEITQVYPLITDLFGNDIKPK